jgi:hypothetical protein
MELWQIAQVGLFVLLISTPLMLLEIGMRRAATRRSRRRSRN